MTLVESIREMVRRDLLRAVRSMPMYRPGTLIADATEATVDVPVSIECWGQVYGAEMFQELPLDALIVEASLKYHAGKREWELQSWRVVQRMGGGALLYISAPKFGPWGVGEIEWTEATPRG